MNSPTLENEPLLEGKHDGPLPSKVSFRKGGFITGTLVVLYATSFSVFTPVLSQYMHGVIEKQYFNSSDNANEESFCRRNLSDNHTKTMDKIQKETSQRILYFTYAAAITSVFVNLVLGSYSDVLGRKMLFLIPLTGGLGKTVVSAVIIHWNFNSNFFYLAFALDGIGGSFGAFLLAVFAYTADITPPTKTRTFAVAIMEGCIAIAISVGMLATGYLIKSVGYTYPALITVILLCISVVIVVFAMTETTKKRNDVDYSPLVHLKSVWGILIFRGTRRRRLQYNICLMIFFFGVLKQIGRNNIETIYQLDEPFCWTPVQIGYYGALQNFIQGLCSVFAIKVLQLCMRDELIAFWGNLDCAGSLVLEALAVNSWMLYSVPVVGMISATNSPVARSLMSRMTSPAEQGAIFSCISTVESVCSVFSNTLYNEVYEATVSSFKGTTFLVMGAFSVLTMILIVVFIGVSEGVGIEWTVEIPPKETDIQNETQDS